jgi:hypothetical protein
VAETASYEVLALASTPDLSLMTYLAKPATPSADATNLLRSWTANEVTGSRTGLASLLKSTRRRQSSPRLLSGVPLTGGG